LILFVFLIFKDPEMVFSGRIFNSW